MAARDGSSRGRPIKLTPELQKRICDAISGGNYRDVAAKWVGVGRSTFCTWMRKGKKQRSGLYVEFRRAVLEAETAAEIRCVALVIKAAAEDPKHAQWWLERKVPDRWGRRDRVEHSGDPKKPVKHDVIAEVVLPAPAAFASFLEDVAAVRRGDDANAGSVPQDGS